MNATTMILDNNALSFEEKFQWGGSDDEIYRWGAKLIVQASLVPLLSYTKCWEQLHPSLSTVIS